MNKGLIFELQAASTATTATGSGGPATVADIWHTDLTCEASPPAASILRMVKCPRVGGDTMFTSLSAAYDALSAPLKELCDGLSALHDNEVHRYAEGMPEKTKIH